MASSSSSAKDKGKRPLSPEEPEEGKLLPLVLVQTQQTKKKKTNPKVSFFEVVLGSAQRRAEAWQEWFKRPQRKLTNSNSLSFKYKECEPISDNKIRWINFMSWVTPMLKRCHLGGGLYGMVFKVGVLEPTLASDLETHDVVFYVAKMLHKTEWSSAKDQMHKKLFAFTVSHPIVVRPVAAFADLDKPELLFPWWNGGDIRNWYIFERALRGKLSKDGLSDFLLKDLEKYDADHCLHASIFRRHRLKIAAILLQGLVFIHGHGWLHCDIHFGNVLVHFPLWNWLTSYFITKDMIIPKTMELGSPANWCLLALVTWDTPRPSKMLYKGYVATILRREPMAMDSTRAHKEKGIY
ncbi:hypothetical protein R1flu_004982 [Riccia fluitans]|uniref:Protein kinase domain-containing protein n=1 Tax=Riccia fluitans TaxID=41844 RepID=A0ABD1YSF9_9MARC